MDIKTLLENCENALISAWSAGRAELNQPPWLCYISLTNHCNSSCRVCAHRNAMRAQRGFMTNELFRTIVDQLPLEVKKVYLQKQGEPFLHPGLDDMVAYLRQTRPDIHIAFHTNGLLAQDRRLRKILPLIDSLGVSISAISAPAYHEVHGVQAFHVVQRNLAALSDILLSMKENQRPHVFIDYVIQEANSSEEEARVVDFFRTRFPGLASVDFHWAYNFQGEIGEANLQIYDRLDHQLFPCCVFPWSSITFCHDGRVSYCFVEPRENRFLGDINTRPFMEIWQSEDYASFRRRMAGADFSSLAADGFHCHKCSWLWSMKSQSPRNLAAGYASKLDGRTNSQRMGELLDQPLIDIFRRAVACYLSGEIHQAAGIFQFLSSSAGDTQIGDAAKVMSARCVRVFQKYQNISIWQKALAAEGWRAEDRQCRYYPLGDNNAI